jgi:hypothetical protein
VIIPERLELGIHGFVDKLFGTVLDAAVTVHALVVNGVDHLAGLETPVIIDLVNTLFLYTNGALQTPLFPGNDP